MRLGQLARKFGVSKKEIIAYLREIDPALHSLGQNTKLDERTIALLSGQFENPEELFLQPTFAPINIRASVGKQEQQPASAKASADTQGSEVAGDGETGLNEQGSDTPLPAEAKPRPPIPIYIGNEPSVGKPRKEDEVIETDKLLELLESEESTVDLSKITLIRAPKRELDGLKVVGRIELPEPKSKPEKKEHTKESGPAKNHRQPQSPLSVEEREQRRLKAKRRQEEYQARQEKRQKAKEKKHRKALSKARYEQKLEKARTSQLKQKQITPKPAVREVEETPDPPKTLLGKIWRWMTTY